MKTTKAKKTLTFIGLAVLALAIVLIIAIVPSLDNREDERVFYGEQGELLTGRQEIDGKTYILDADGRITRGWISYEGAKYHQTDDGLSMGECVIDDKNYHFEEDGRFITGMYEENGEFFCRNAYGYFEEGMFFVDGKQYYSEAGGKIVLGWKDIDGKKHYFMPESGIMATGMQKIEDKQYLFDSEGVMQTGWQKDGEVRYYYHEDGHMAIGWNLIDDVRFCFGDDGACLTGWNALEDGTYYFNEDGTVWTGWMLNNDVYFYFDEQGVMAVGETVVDDVNYFFCEDGSLKNGWDENKYYVNGYVAKGATTIDGKLYLFDNNGAKAAKGWNTWNGKKYYVVDDNALLQTGFLTLDGNTYYFDSKGRMATGITRVDGKKYYFYSDGTMAKNVTIENYKIDENGVVTDLFSKITSENLYDYIDYLLEKNGDSILDIYNYVRDTFPYRYREKKSIEEMACRMLNYGNGACWDYAALTYLMLKQAGYNCQIVIGKGAVYSEHNWILIETSPGVWRHLDTERKSLRVYLWTDEELKAVNWITKNVRYEWDYDAYPKAE